MTPQHTAGTPHPTTTAPRVIVQPAVLSEAARDYILRVAMDWFDANPSPEIPESVMAEIAAWAYSKADGLDL